MQKIVNKLITSSIKDVDVYRWKNATWLIFTDETRWVVEMTDEGTLWYNYKFFKDIFKYVSITVGTEMDGYIIQWANEYFFKVSQRRFLKMELRRLKNVVRIMVMNLNGILVLW
jgi:hypothetical protein